MSEVRFVIFGAEDPWHLITRIPNTTGMHQFLARLPDHGPDLAAEVARVYFETDASWQEWFDDMDHANVMVEILSPEINKGVYDVEMERMVTATAQRAKDPRP